MNVYGLASPRLATRISPGVMRPYGLSAFASSPPPPFEAAGEHAASAIAAVAATAAMAVRRSAERMLMVFLSELLMRRGRVELW